MIGQPSKVFQSLHSLRFDRTSIVEGTMVPMVPQKDSTDKIWRIPNLAPGLDEFEARGRET